MTTPSGLPTCAQLCISSNYLPGCGTADIRCLCTDPGFVNNVSLCICNTCVPNDALTAYSVYAQICGLSRATASCPSSTGALTSIGTATSQPSTISPGSTSNSSPAGISASTSSNAAPTTRTPSKVSGGIIAAIVVPIVFALVAVLLLFWYLRRRRKNQRYLRGVAQEKLDKAREEDRGRLELDARANEIFHAGSAALPAQADSTPMYQIDSSSRTIEQDRSTIDGGNGGAAELYSPVSPPPLAQTFATNPRSLGSETPPPDHSPTEVVLSGERPRSLAEAPDTEIPRSHPQSLTTASGSAQPDVQSARNSTADSVSDIFYDPLPEPDSASSQGITEPETPPGRQGLQQKLSELRANRQVLERINEMRRQEQLLEKRIAMMNPD